MSRFDRIVAGEGRELVPAEAAAPTMLTRLWQSLGLGRKPPIRLLAVPRDPIAGDKAAGAALMEGIFRVGERAFDPSTLTPGEDPAAAGTWERLQGFGWVRDLAAAATPQRGREAAEALTRIWLERMPQRPEGPAWRADLWGRRLLLWPTYAPYLLASRDASYRASLLRLLVRGAAHIEKAGDKCRPGLPRIAAWSGAVSAALLVQGATGRLGRCEAGLERALKSGLGDDGGLLSRAPAEQVELVELLALLRAAYATSTRGMPDWLEEAQEGALACLLCVAAADGRLSSWQGGHPGSTARLAAAIAGATVTEAPAPRARGWGYQRLQAKETSLVIDAAPPPTAKHRHGACASTLAFEFSDGPQRLVVNCGGGDHLPAELSQLLRSTAAHSTLVLGDTNSTAILDSGGLGRGVEEVTMERGTRDGQPFIEASHDGYIRRFGLVHRRELLLAADGRTLSGTDALAAKGKVGKQPVSFVMRFHLAPGVEVISTADGRGALLRLKGKKAWQFKVRGARVDAEDSIWIDGEGQPCATQQLAVTGESPPDGMTISWELKRAG
jgi:uncharacterized heparinase superfamily protein